MALKTSIFSLCRSQFRVYSNEDGIISKIDLIIFILFPILLGVTYVLFVENGTEALRYIYGSIAFLSGFIFSAFIVVMNLAAIISGNIQGRASKAVKKTVREVAVISLFVFICGVSILAIGVFDLIVSNSTHELSGCFSKIIQAFVIILTANIVLNLFMVAKKLHSVIDDILSIEN